jgi:mycothiol synthase
MTSFDLRPVGSEDMEAIRALVDRAQQHDGLPHVLTAEELHEELQVPYVELASDTRVAIVGCEVVGWAWVWNPPAERRQDRAYLFGAVDPEYRGRGVGRTLLGWALGRATERQRGRTHDLPRYIRVDAFESMEADHHLFSRLGFVPVRWFDELIQAVDNPPRVVVPSDIALVAWPDDRDDEIRVLRNEAFADHWGSTPLDAGLWHAAVRGHGARPDLSVIAVDRATDSVVGACLNHAYPEDDDLTGRREAWIEHLATTKPERGRGLASAMIAWSLGAFRANNFTHAGIVVDSDNPTGAARLYRKLGFETLRRSITYEIEVR